MSNVNSVNYRIIRMALDCTD